MEQLIDLKVDRVLTSGLEKTAEEGIPLLKELQSRYGSRIEILPGSGVRAENARRIMREVGVNQVHSSCKEWARRPNDCRRKSIFCFTRRRSKNVLWDGVYVSNQKDVKIMLRLT